MRSRKLIILLIVLLSFVTISLTVLFVGLLSNSFRFSDFKFGHRVSNELVLDETYDLDFAKLNIEVDTSDIYIKNSLNNKTRVVIYGDKKNTKVETSNNILNIQSKEKRCVGFCFNFKIPKVEIYLPVNFDKDIVVQNKYGDIKIEEFLNANIIVEEDCGDVSVLGGNYVNITNKYGDITINKANVGNIEEDCGDVKIGTIDDITVENSYGDIKIGVVNNYLDLKNNCGDIKIDAINLNKNSVIKDDLGNIKIGTTNEIYINAKTDLGKVNINNNYNKSDITLKIDNNCGDIKVSN